MNQPPRMPTLTVEVVPQTPRCWVIVVWDASGEFVIDFVASSAMRVYNEVERELRHYVPSPHRLIYVDESGNEWSPDRARDQALRLGIEFSE